MMVTENHWHDKLIDDLIVDLKNGNGESDFQSWIAKNSRKTIKEYLKKIDSIHPQDILQFPLKCIIYCASRFTLALKEQK